VQKKAGMNMADYFKAILGLGGLAISIAFEGDPSDHRNKTIRICNDQ
jgi:hypothetical protein